MTNRKETIQLVEQHLILASDPRFAIIDQAAFASKNLYNLGNYHIRQHFFETGRILTYETLYHDLKGTDAYQALSAKVSQQALKVLCRSWEAWRAANQDFAKNPHKYLGQPRIPKYKAKAEGRFLLTYTSQAISKRDLKKGLIKPSRLDITVPTDKTHINQVRIVPRKRRYVIEVVYTVEIEPNPDLDPGLIAGVDINLNVLAAVTTNKPGFVPVVINGRPLKAINQFYNKRKAKLQAELQGERQTSRRIDKLGQLRDGKINHYLHTASRQIIDHLVGEGIGTLVIGKNDNWKQKINLGRKTNQNFVSIPQARFVEMLAYKATLAGMQVVIQEESHSSKVSFLDLEAVNHQAKYLGRRMTRSVFKASDGRLIHADVNAAFNIIRKAFPLAFGPAEMEGVVVRPARLRINLGASKL